MATISLRDFLPTLTHPVVWHTAVGTPMGDTDAIHGEYEIDVVSQCDLYDLEGQVVDGEWEWDGEGDPRAYRNNSILRLKVYNDETAYNRIIHEYETAHD